MGAGRPFGTTKPKIMADALILALNRAASDGSDLKKINTVAAKLVACAEGGDVTAIREIFDRVDGRPTQNLGNDPENPLFPAGATEAELHERIEHFKRALSELGGDSDGTSGTP